MNRKKKRLFRILASLLAAVIIICMAQVSVGFAAEESLSGETMITAEAMGEAENESKNGSAVEESIDETASSAESADNAETTGTTGTETTLLEESADTAGNTDTEVSTETAGEETTSTTETMDTTGSTESVNTLQQFLAAAETLPDHLTSENYEETMETIWACMELYEALSEDEKALTEVILIHQQMEQLIKASYGTQTLEVGYYTDHNTIMRLPDNYMGVADWGYVRYRTVNGDIAYCIEPDVGVEGAGDDYPMSSSPSANITLNDYQKRALCYILYYGYYKSDVPEDWQTSFGVGNQSNEERNMAINHQEDLAYYAATQVAAWAVIQGYTLTDANREEVRNTSNGCWAGHMFTAEQISSLQSLYTGYFNSIWNNAMAAMNTTIPSFAASSGFTYPTHTLAYNASTQKYQITLTDTNGVVSSVYQSYSGGGSGVSITRSGNSITISSSSPISGSRLITAVPASGTGQAKVPTAALIYWTWTTEDWQKFASYGSPTTEAINAYFYINSTQPGYVKITKTDAKTAEALAGAVYGVYLDSACTNLFTTVTIGTDGTGTSSQVPPTTLYLKEITAPTGYALSTAVIPVTVGSGATAAVSVTDEPLSTCVALKKTDETDSSIIITEAVFGLYRYSQSKGGYEFINYMEYNLSAEQYESGTLYYTLDSLGKYKVVEEAAQDGYLYEAWSKEFTVTDNAGKVLELTVNNTPTRYRFVKVDDQGDPLAGCSFELYDSAGKLIDSWTTDNTGVHELTAVLLEGESYTLKETGYPLGYAPAEDIRFTVGAEQEWMEIRTVNAMIPGTVTVYKTSADGSTLPGVSIALCSTQPVSGGVTLEHNGKTWYVLQEKTAGEDGKVIFENLDTVSGYSYLVVETSTVEGKTLMAEPVEIGTLPVNAGTSVDSSYTGTIQKRGEEYFLYDHEVRLVNSTAFVLPFTGAQGDFIFCTAAMMVMAVCGYFLLCQPHTGRVKISAEKSMGKNMETDMEKERRK